MGKRRKCGAISDDARQRSVRLYCKREGSGVFRWAALVSLSGKSGCTPEALRRWVGDAEIVVNVRPGAATDTTARMKELEREFRELGQANEIPKKASAHFAQQPSGDLGGAKLDRQWRQ